MPFHQPDQVRYYTFSLLDEENLNHAVFTRKGGVSKAPWAELNMGLTVGDNPEHVRENKIRSYRTMGREYSSHFDSWLVHGTGVAIADAPHPANLGSPPKADIILTDNPEVTLYMRFADCVPILLYDPVRKVAGLAHAGWQGTVKKVPLVAVQAMQAHYGTQPRDVIACIGPSIGPEKYQVGSDVVEQVRESFGADAAELLPQFDETYHFDLWQANQLSLQQAGVSHIQIAGICTATHAEDWFSHRQENGKTGRFGVLVSL